jgi:AcrR family transcriptional regulator
LWYRLWAVSTLQTKRPENRAYHHGDLRNALIDAAVAAARQHGPTAVVLRDIARQVGVSHNAGYRHFASRDDLLSAVAARGLTELAANMQKGVDGAPKRREPRAQARQRLRAIGRAYVEFARAEPGLFRTIWAAAAYPVAPPEEGLTVAEASDPYLLLNAVLDDLVAVGAIPKARRPYSETAAWAAVHGLATLLIDGPLGAMPPSEVDRALDRLCDVIDAGL